MRRSSYLHNLSLIRLLTFVSVIGSQFHILSTSAASTKVANFHFDAFNTTNKKTTTTTSTTTSEGGGGGGATISSSSSAAFLPSAATTSSTSTTSAHYESKTSIIMTSSSSSSSSSTRSSSYISGSSSSSTSSGSGVSSSSSSTSVMPDGSYTAASSSSMHNTLKSTSKIPFDFTLSKNHWANSDTLGLRNSATSASSTTTVAAAAPPAPAAIDRARTFRSKHHHEHHWGPFFEEPLNSTATGDNVVTAAHLFTEAVLNCRVGMLKDKTVMWVRRTTEKVSLLTVGNVTYSGDPRIRVKFQYPNNWRLLINPTQKEDAGVYMCQVSTHPPRVFTTNLTILEPPLRLIDDQEREVGDRYYKSGSTIDLQCQVSRSFVQKEKLSILKSIQPIDQNQTTKTNTHKMNAVANRNGAGYNELFTSTNQTLNKQQGQGLEKQFNNFIFWAKHDEMLPATAVKRASTTEKWLNSRISIPDAKLSDSGNYSCSIGKLFTAIVQVQVLTGELPAAVQHNSAAPSASQQSVHTLLLHFSWIYLIAAFIISSYTRTLPTSTPVHRSTFHFAKHIAFHSN